ncbi:uncharacterized protein TM35_000122310 [Trypanosoma theileri]|uniref:DUF4833 domain-containing protein n=1 Tax=Trypanosoma theileri TaxID=67003 RepID=A0A1X0NXM7_9TRYP|nr:uncharacterized protein TM35_000122310 [Trypanosoma theileri]ORC89456.1 hypothetical protein TM35_000122310 [Trypanosoma theileri]
MSTASTSDDAGGIARKLFELYGKNAASLNRLLRRRIGTRGNRFNHDHADTFMYIERSKNSNIVAYTANMMGATTKASVSSGAGQSCLVDPHNPVHAYFITLDPPTLESRRKRGITSDIDDLTFIQRKLAYGCHAKPLHNVTGFTTDEAQTWFKSFEPFAVSYVALPKVHALLLLLSPLAEGEGEENGPEEKDTTVALVAVVGGKLSVMQRVYVNSTEPKHFYQLPTVNYIEVFGVSLESDEPVYEKIEK